VRHEELGPREHVQQEIEITQRVETVDQRVDAVDQRVGTVEGTVTKETQRVDEMGTRVNTLGTTITETSVVARSKEAPRRPGEGRPRGQSLTRLWSNRYNPKPVETINVLFGLIDRPR
jgi:hypothetical protein